MATYTTTYAERWRRALRVVGLGIANAAGDADDASSVVLLKANSSGDLANYTSGSAVAPSFGTTGIAMDLIAESTAANGVAVDGLTIKDGSVRPTVIADPGDGGAIPVTSSGVCALTTAAAETRTLAIPTFLGQRLTLVCDTYAVGDAVVTCAAAFNAANNTIMTFGVVSDACELVAVTVGGALVWQMGWNDGVALS